MAPACALLLLTAALGAPPWSDAPPPGQRRVSMLLCDGQGSCAEDAAWIEAQGLLQGEVLVLVDLLLELDAGGWVDGANERGALEESLTKARAAAAEGRWGAVEAATDRAYAALDRWPGTLPPETLFDLAYLQGAARLHARKNLGHEQSFRQAAAMLDGPPGALPSDDGDAGRAFTDEQRKLRMAGTGTLLLGLVPPETRIWVDGRPVPPETDELTLAPARHRVTALGRDGIHTWQADVPVLGERVSRVIIDLPVHSSAAWVTEELGSAFSTLQAPDELRDLLAGWCKRHRAQQVRLLRVTQASKAQEVSPLTVGPSSPTRPEAAQGEAVDHGDGIPTTYEAQLEADLAQREDVHAHESERRLNVIFFDPLTGHLHADGGTPAALTASPTRHLRLGARVGYAGMIARHHAELDLEVATHLGAFWLGGSLGLARADVEYRLYPDWNDRQLYRVAAGARWVPRERRLSPFLGLEAQAWIPVTLGVRALAGGELSLGAGWLVQADVHTDATGRGLGWGGGVGVGREF
ncbi:MAG: hypothetical protein ABIO70_05530 [Pseudomonadota bacterium]